MISLFAHAGEEHAETVVAGEGLLSTIGHLPTVVSLLLIIGVLTVVFVGLGLLKVAVMNRVLVLMLLVIVIAVLFMQYNPLVSITLLAVGFGGVFMMVITLLSAQRH